MSIITTLSLLIATISVVFAQTYTQVNVIQFSDADCLCANQQQIYTTDLCIPDGTSYEITRIDGEHVVVQTCTDDDCKNCVNTTTYDVQPPCQSSGKGATTYITVHLENEYETYYNAPSLLLGVYNTSSCSSDPIKVDIEFGLSCFTTEQGTSYYYECVGGSSYYVYNCSDNACLQNCTSSSSPAQQCTAINSTSTDKNATYYTSITCSDSTSTSTSTGNSATAGNGASATVSTTTSASSHNVSSSASAAGTASSSTGGSINSIFTNDVRGGYIRRSSSPKKTIRNPPFCNGGSGTASSASSIGPSTSATSSPSATAGTSSTGGTSGGAASNSASATSSPSASASASSTGKSSRPDPRSRINIH